MKTLKILVPLIYILLCCQLVTGQERVKTKVIRAKGDYIHKTAKTVFPEHLEQFTRKAIYSFDKEDNNIGVVYGNENFGNNTIITIYVYPAGDGYDGRLRNAYFASLQLIANMSSKGLDAVQHAVRYKGEKYICNGYKAELKKNHYEYNQLALYECGTWFFKIRLTTNCLDEMEIINVEDKILEKFDPSQLTAQNPLNTKAEIVYGKVVLKDSTLFLAAKESANKRIEWVLKNVDENERASGFPDQYLDMHVEAIKTFVQYEKEHNLHETEATKLYFAEFNKIIDAGFLPEFILDEFGMMMIFPENMEDKFDAYFKWKQSHPLTVSLGQKLYALNYKQVQ